MGGGGYYNPGEERQLITRIEVVRIRPQRVAGDSVDAWSVHYEGLARLEAGEDIIVLSVGQETEELTAPEIVDAAVDSLRQGRHHYTNVNAEYPTATTHPELFAGLK